MSREDCCSGSTAIVSFILGSLAGAAAVLLLAPQARQESAERVREFSNDLKGRAADYLEQAKGTVSSTVGRGRDFLDEKRSLIQSAVEAGKEAYQREKGKAGSET